VRRRPILEVAEAAYALALPLREARAAVKREAGRNSQWRSWEPRYLVARLRAHVHEKHPLDGRCVWPARSLTHRKRKT